MAAWTRDGPISLPPRSFAYGAAAAVVLLAALAAGLGFRATLRQAQEPGAAGASSETGGDTLTARPIVELPPPVTAEAASDKAADTPEADKSKELASQTAAAQAIQAKPSKDGGDVDTIMTSPTEKPPPPVKAGADEAPPGTPVKSDVPF